MRLLNDLIFTRKCAENAGFIVPRMIKNPVAACLAYDLEEDTTQSK